MKKIISILAITASFSLMAMSNGTDKSTADKVEKNATARNIIYIKEEKPIAVEGIRDKVTGGNIETEKDELAKYKHYQTGTASYYGGKWHGRKTANGEIFNQNSMTAAHKTLPFGTKVRVTNLNNGKSVIVRINNRGPYTKGRIIDLSKAAFSKIENTGRGVTRVKLEIMK